MLVRYKSLVLFIVYVVFVLGFTNTLFYIATTTDFHAPTQELLTTVTAYNDSALSTWEKLVHRVSVQPFNLVSFFIFALAIFHTFFSNSFTRISERVKKRHQKKTGKKEETFLTEILHFLGEVEVVFGIWVIPLVIAMSYYFDWSTALHYLDSRDYTEPLFVVVIMVLASTEPIFKLAEDCLRTIARLGGRTVKAWWLTILTVGPFLGSFITEPGAMTISALLMSKQLYSLKPSKKLTYATLGLLFTNISVGGVFTNFAAPPVLMVSKAWGWSSMFMLTHFGWKALIGIIIANVTYFFLFWEELDGLEKKKKYLNEEELFQQRTKIPLWIGLTHLGFLAWIVVHSHFPVIFLGSFLLFLGFYRATLPYQSDLNLKTPILVGFFLAGLVVHGSLQAWWISPILSNVSNAMLMVMATILTAFNDNAEITFLATLIPSFTDSMKYVVVAGAVTGGGLTVIANAPNPAGQALLSKHFPYGVSAVKLFAGALLPTLIMGCVFYFL